MLSWALDVAGRVSSSASTKLKTTPSVTVTPIARSTGTSEIASSANTISVDSEQTSTACSVRRCSARSRCGVLEEQRVVESEAGGEDQRDQVEQVERHAARAQHGEHDQRRQRHRCEHAVRRATCDAQRDRDHADEQQRGDRERPQHARALRGDERFRRAFRIEQPHVVAGACRECSATRRRPARR